MEQEYPQLSLLAMTELSGNDIRDYQSTLKTLQQYPDIDVFICHGAYGNGTWEVIREAGYFGRAIILCYDSSETVVEMIQQGSISAMITQGPHKQGYMALHQMFSLLTDGQELPLETNFFIPTKVYFKENLPEFEYK